MKQLLILSRLQLLANLRNQVHLVTLFVLTGLMMLPAYVNSYSLGPSLFATVTKDLGLTMISYFGVLMSVLIGSQLIANDIDRKTIYPLLARPLGRFTYLAGQWLGVTCLLTVSLVFLSAALGLGIYSLLRVFDPNLMLAALGYSLECGVLLAACLCFSLFVSPALAGVLGLLLYALGGLSSSFLRYLLVSRQAGPIASGLLAFAKGLIPNFDVFRLKYAVSHGLAIPPSYGIEAAGYAAGWVFLLLGISTWKFAQKDL